MNKKVITVLSSVLLATATIGTINTITPTQQVQAISKRTWHWHWVKIKSHKVAYKINPRYPRSIWLKNVTDAVKFPKGYVVRVRYFSNDHYFQIRASDIGEHGTWIVPGKSTRWFRNY